MVQKQGKRNVTMYDVAALAGVSQTTVSFVLSGTSGESIPEETKNRVRRAAKQLGYRLNAAAKVLATRKSNLIGFITDEIATTPFAGGIIKAAQDAAWSHNKLLVTFNTSGRRDIEEAAIEVMLEQQVEGIIYSAMYHRPVELPANIHEVPAVLVNCFAPDRSLPSVVPDEVGGGRSATEFLIARGHKRIAFINIGPRESELPAVTGRQKGYEQALAAHDLAFGESLVRYGVGVAADGYRYALELMKQPDAPTAIFCGNDRIAMGAYDALKEMGLRIPDDVAVVGFDNLEMISTEMHPALTTLELPHRRMGQWGVEFLLQYDTSMADTAGTGGMADRGGMAGMAGMAGMQNQAPVQHVIECKLISRSSA